MNGTPAALRSARRSGGPVAEQGWARVAVTVGIVAVLAPLVVSAIAALIDGPLATVADRALMELRVRDIGTHPVLVGLYSRDGWSHPGPLVYFTLAIPYRIVGSTTAGLLVGALLVNGISLAGMALIARRLGGARTALAMLVVVSVLVRALGAVFIRDPWVCFITVLPFGLFCCIVWALTAGEVWALPLGAFVASWLTQTHVGYLPLTLPLLGAGGLWLFVSARRWSDRARFRRVSRAVGITVVVLAGAWVLPVWDQIFGSGNLGNTAEWFSRAAEGVHTVREGARVVFGQFAALPDWVTGQHRVGLFNRETLLMSQTLWPVLVLPFVGASVIAWKRRDHAVVRLAVVTGGAALVGVVAVARTVGTMYEYRLLWTWVIGALGVVVVVATLWNVAADRWPGADRILIPIAVVVLAALGVAQIVDVASLSRPDWDSPETATVARELDRKLDPHRGVVVLRSESDAGAWDLQGLLLALEQRGFDARVVRDGVSWVGQHRVVGRERIQARLLVLATTDLAQLRGAVAKRLVAYGGSVPRVEEVAAVRRRAARYARLLSDLNAGRISATEYGREFAQVGTGLRQAVAVVRDVQ